MLKNTSLGSFKIPVFWLAEDRPTVRVLLTGLLVAISAMAVWGLIRLRINSDPRFLTKSWHENDPSLLRLQETFPASDQTSFVLMEADDVLSAENLKVLKDLHGEIRRLEGVEQVISLLSIRSKRHVGRYLLPLITVSRLERERDVSREEIADHPLIQNTLLALLALFFILR